MKFVDLSVAIEDGLPVDPPPQITHIKYTDHRESVKDMLKLFPGVGPEVLPGGYGWAVEDIVLNSHSGTHVDAPWHYHPTMDHGRPSWTIDKVPLDWFFGDGVVLDFSDKPDGYVITPDDLIAAVNILNYKLKPGDIVFIHTRAPEEWGKASYLSAGCGVGREGTLWLCEQGVHVVGTDAWSWDAPLSLVAKRYAKEKDPGIIWEAHKAGADCIYCHIEKLSALDTIPATGFKVACFPVKIKDAGAGWTRVVAMIDE